jgi:hypothetical protein
MQPNDASFNAVDLSNVIFSNDSHHYSAAHIRLLLILRNKIAWLTPGSYFIQKF